MSTPRTAFTSCTGYFIPLIILFDPEDEDTTLHVVYAPSLSDHVSASLPPCIRLSPSATSSSLLPPLLLPSSSRKKSRSPTPPAAAAVSPPAPSAVALVAAAPALPVTNETIQEVIPLLVTRLARHDGVTDEVLDEMDELPPERIESVEDDVETLRARLASTEQETVTLCARVETLEQHDEDSQETDKLHITELRSQVGHESCKADRLEMADLRSQAQDIEAHL
ncbi:hypothetical protein Tco_0269559 [Tanacetum coccineum]